MFCENMYDIIYDIMILLSLHNSRMAHDFVVHGVQKCVAEAAARRHFDHNHWAIVLTGDNHSIGQAILSSATARA